MLGIFLTKYLGRQFSYILQEIFVILHIHIYRHIIHVLFPKAFCKFITLCDTIQDILYLTQDIFNFTFCWPDQYGCVLMVLWLKISNYYMFEIKCQRSNRNLNRTSFITFSVRIVMIELFRIS